MIIIFFSLFPIGGYGRLRSLPNASRTFFTKWRTDKVFRIRCNREDKAKFNAQTVTVHSLGIVRGSGQSAEREMSLASHDDFPPSSYRFHYAPCPKDPTCT